MRFTGVVLCFVVFIAAVNSQFTLRNRSPYQDRRAQTDRFVPRVVQRNPVQTRHNSVQPRRNTVQTRRSPVQTRRIPTQTRRNPVQTRRNPVQSRRNPVQTRRMNLIVAQRNSANSGRALRVVERVPVRSRQVQYQTRPFRKQVSGNSDRFDRRELPYRPQNNRPDDNNGRQRESYPRVVTNQARPNLHARFPFGRQLPRRNTFNTDSPFVMQNWNSYTGVDGNVVRSRQTTASPAQRPARQPQNSVSHSVTTRYNLDHNIDLDLDNIFSYGQRTFLETGMVFGNNDFDLANLAESYYPFEATSMFDQDFS